MFLQKISFHMGGGGAGNTVQQRTEKKKTSNKKNLQPDKLIVDILNLEAV